MTDSPSDASPISPDGSRIVTAIIGHEIRPGSEPQYDAWSNDIRRASERFPGYLSTDVIRPVMGHHRYTIILRFEDFEALTGWMESDVRRSLLKRVEPILQDGPRYDIRTGIDFLFDPPGAVKHPVPWKQFLITWSAIFPLTIVVPWLLQPLFENVPLLGSLLPNKALVAACIVFLMVYVLMPPYTRALSKWLFR